MTRLWAILLVFVSGFLSAQTSFTYRFRGLPAVGGGATHGDFNKNGSPDIAVTSNQGPGEFVSVFSGGDFSTRRDYPVPESGALAAADVNNDGWLDIGVAQFESQSVLLLMNNGHGTFRQGNVIPACNRAFDLEFGDFNNDGAVDMLVRACDSSGACRLRLFQGNGTGTFIFKSEISVGGSFVVTDLNRDGRLDVAQAAQKKVWLSFGRGDGTFRALTSFSVPDADGADTITAADFNNDTTPDLAVLSPHPCGSACGNNTVYTYKNNGAGSFTLKSSFRIGGSGFGELYPADINGDLNADVVVRNGDHFGGFLAYALGRGNWVFDRIANLPSSEVSDFLDRDWNLDSRHDIAWSSWFNQEIIVGTNTNGFTNCAPPNSARIGVRICGPLGGSTLTGSALVKASGNSPAGVKRMEVWVDGVKKYEKWHDQINKRIALSPGRHRIAVVAVDKYVGRSWAAVFVNVQ
ncbi:MAG: VCBS repeat-containing protein [Acidobacteriales bacterium]|nr:VCBS repeat-containing protein [Terriglobales bacterium]